MNETEPSGFESADGVCISPICPNELKVGEYPETEFKYK